MQSDIDLNRASPREEGVDVFNVTFFMSCDEVYWFFVNHFANVFVILDQQFEMLQTACRLHTTTHRTGNPTIDACFDADRLDLGRVGITPDPNRMATEKGKEMAKNL